MTNIPLTFLLVCHIEAYPCDGCLCAVLDEDNIGSGLDESGRMVSVVEFAQDVLELVPPVINGYGVSLEVGIEMEGDEA